MRHAPDRLTPVPRWAVRAGVVLVTLGIGTGVGQAGQDRPSPVRTAPTGAGAATGMLPIPEPPLDDLEPAVAAQIREVQRALDQSGRASTGDDGRRAESYGTLGQLYHAYEFFDAAEACYRNALRLAPDEPRWLHLLGYLSQQVGRLEEARERYEAALRADPEDYPLLVYLGDVHLQLDQPAAARARFESALPRFPAAARYGLGQVALLESRFASAARDFETALRLAPEASQIHYALAMAYRGLGDLDRASRHLAEVGPNGVRPADPFVADVEARVRGERVLAIRGRRAYEAGRFDEAVAAFRQAVAAAPSSADAHVNLGAALAQSGDVGGATAELELALRLDPATATAHASLGSLLALEGHYADAIDHLREAARLDPGLLEARRQLSQALLNAGREAEAIDVLFEVTGLAPDDEASLLTLSILLANAGRYGDALSLLDAAHARRPDRAPIATTLARLLAAAPELTLRDGARALTLARAVHDTAPTATHRETVALSLAELGRCEEAEEWIERAIQDAADAGQAGVAERLEGTRTSYQRRPCRP